MTTLNTISGDGMKEARLVYLNQPQTQPQPAPDAFDNLHVRAEDQRGDMFEQKYDRVYDQVESRLSEYDAQTNDLVRSLDDAFVGATEQEERGDDAALQQYDAAVESLSGELRMSFKKTESGTYAKLSEIESRYSQIENVIAELERALAERGDPVDRTFREDAVAEREQAALQSGEIRSVDIHSTKDGFKSIEVKPAYFLVRMPASFKPDFGPAASEVRVMPASGGAQYLRITEAGAQMLDGKTISITTGDGTKINATVSRASSQYGNVIFTYEKPVQATPEVRPSAETLPEPTQEAAPQPAPEAAPAPKPTPAAAEAELPTPADEPMDQKPLEPTFAEEPPASPPEPPAEAEAPAAPEAADESVENLKNQFAESVNRIVTSIEGGMVGQAEMEVDAANAILQKITNPFEKTAAMVQAGLMAEKQGDNGMTERSSTPKIIEGEENTGTYELFAGLESDRIFLEKQEAPAEEEIPEPPTAEEPVSPPEPPEDTPAPTPETTPETKDFFGQVQDAVEGIRQQIYSGAEPTTIEVSRAVTELNDLIKANEYSKDDALMLSGVMNGMEVTNDYNDKTYVIGLDENNQVAVTEKAPAAPAPEPESTEDVGELTAESIAEGLIPDVQALVATIMDQGPDHPDTKAALASLNTKLTSAMDEYQGPTTDIITALDEKHDASWSTDSNDGETYAVVTEDMSFAIQKIARPAPEAAPAPAPEDVPAPPEDAPSSYRPELETDPTKLAPLSEETLGEINAVLRPKVDAVRMHLEMGHGAGGTEVTDALRSLNDALKSQSGILGLYSELGLMDGVAVYDPNNRANYRIVYDSTADAVVVKPEGAPTPESDSPPAPPAEVDPNNVPLMPEFADEPEATPEDEANDIETAKELMRQLKDDIAQGGMSAEAQDRLVQINRLSDQAKETLANSYGIDQGHDLEIPGNGGKTYTMSYDEDYKSFSITEKAATPASETTPTEPQPGGGEVDPNNEPIEPDEPEAEEETPPADAETPENTETETETEPETEEEAQPAAAETSESSEANEEVQELIRQLKELIESAKKMTEDMKKAQEEARNTPTEDDSASAETPADSTDEDANTTPEDGTETLADLESDLADLESARSGKIDEYKAFIAKGLDYGVKHVEESRAIDQAIKDLDEKIEEKKQQIEALKEAEKPAEGIDESIAKVDTLIERREALKTEYEGLDVGTSEGRERAQQILEDTQQIETELKEIRGRLSEAYDSIDRDTDPNAQETLEKITAATAKINDVIGEESEDDTSETSEEEPTSVDLKSALETVLPGIGVETSGNSVTLTFKTKEQAAAALKAVQYIDSAENYASFLSPLKLFSPMSGVSLTENSENTGVISDVQAVEGNDKAIRVDIDSGSAVSSPVTVSALLAAMNLVKFTA